MTVSNGKSKPQGRMRQTSFRISGSERRSMNKNDLHEWQSARDNAGNSFRYSIDERAGGHVPDVFAYVGRDELSNPPHDVVGLKQHLMPCGVTPLVCVEPDGGK